LLFITYCSKGGSQLDLFTSNGHTSSIQPPIVCFNALKPLGYTRASARHTPCAYSILLQISPFSCPPRLLPVTVARQTQHYIEITACPMHSRIYTKPDKVIPPQVQAQIMILHIQQLPAVLCNALGHCYFPPNMSDLVTEFNNQTLVIASDGSMAHNTATQAWILYGTQTNTRAYGHGPYARGRPTSHITFG
jgi:hypothetical protein